MWIIDKINLRRVKKDGLVLQSIKHQTLDICLAAIEQNRLALQYVHDDILQDVKAAIAAIGNKHSSYLSDEVIDSITNDLHNIADGNLVFAIDIVDKLPPYGDKNTIYLIRPIENEYELYGYVFMDGEFKQIGIYNIEI